MEGCLRPHLNARKQIGVIRHIDQKILAKNRFSLKKKSVQTDFPGYHCNEFLSVQVHIYSVNRWHMKVLLGTQKFRILTRKRNIFTKRYISNFSKSAILGGVISKIEFDALWIRVIMGYTQFSLTFFH